MTLPDLSMIRGDHVVFPLTLYDDDGSPLNLDYIPDITFTAKRSLRDAEPYITKTLDDGVAVVDAEDGTITVTLESADTDTLDIGWWSHRALVWDVQVLDDYEQIRTRRRGMLRVYRDVTTA